jgi:hypothetical protein
MEAFQERLDKLRRNGFDPEFLDLIAVTANRQDVHDRVQLRAEEYEYPTHGCAEGTAWKRSKMESK